MKHMSKLVMHSIIMLLIDGIMVKINDSAFCWGPHETSLRTTTALTMEQELGCDQFSIA